MTMRDLFAEPQIAGLDYRDDFISTAEEAGLLAHLHALDLAPFRFHGWTGNRKTQSFGWRYDFDDDGLLHHVGFTSALKAQDRPALTERLEALIGPPGFTGNAPGGPSRWNTARSMAWEPLRHELVVEVRYDQVTGRRFRHGTGLLRWRPDKAPRQCAFDQLAPELRPSELGELFAA